MPKKDYSSRHQVFKYSAHCRFWTTGLFLESYFLFSLLFVFIKLLLIQVFFDHFCFQISDFGLAKWLPSQWTHHSIAPIEGTFGYFKNSSHKIENWTISKCDCNGEKLLNFCFFFLLQALGSWVLYAWNCGWEDGCFCIWSLFTRNHFRAETSWWVTPKLAQLGILPIIFYISIICNLFYLRKCHQSSCSLGSLTLVASRAERNNKE